MDENLSSFPISGGDVNPHLKVAAKKVLLSRAAFKSVLPTGFIHDPALELLLTVYAYPDGHPARAGLLQACGSPKLLSRWISAFVQMGILIAAPDHISLTNSGLSMVEESLELVLDAQMSASR